MVTKPKTEYDNNKTFPSKQKDVDNYTITKKSVPYKKQDDVEYGTMPPTEFLQRAHLDGHLENNYALPLTYANVTVPIVKKYNVTMNTPLNNPEKIGEIFEDILPPSKMAEARMSSISERIMLNTYLRSILVKRADGELINFVKKGHRSEITSLLSHMKVIEVNPYHKSYITNNVFRTLPDNFVLFRSCYPINFVKNTGVIKCSDDSISINIRVYSMNLFDELCYKMNKTNSLWNKKLSNLWREIMFYQFIREDILKQKINPHFIMMHSYYITDNETIDFGKLKKLKNEYFNKKHDDNKMHQTFEDAIFQVVSTNMTVIASAKIVEDDEFIGNYKLFEKKMERLNPRTDNKLIDNETKKEIDMFMRSRKCIVGVTEAPDEHILQWCMRSYVISDGVVRKQTNIGIHSEDEWNVVLFQLLSLFYTMHKKRFTVRNINWHKNIFIKKFGKKHSIGYWKYIINGIEYFIPNHGDMLMFDSSYEKVETGGFVDSINSGILYNELAPFYNDSEVKTPYGTTIDINTETGKTFDEELSKILTTNFKHLFNNQIFTEFESLNVGFVNPPQSVSILMNNIYDIINPSSDGNGYDGNFDKINLLEKTMIENFNQYLHNKLGTIVTQQEVVQAYNFGENIENTRKGELLIYKETVGLTELLKWVILINFDTTNNSVKVIHRSHDSVNKITKILDVNKSTVAKFNGIVTQGFDPDNPIVNDEIIDVFTC